MPKLQLSAKQERMFSDVEHAIRCDYGGWSGETSYPYISLYWGRFQMYVEKFLFPNMSVIDIGCGGGDKLLAFNELCKNLKITGLEHHPTMAAYARYVAPFATVIEGDAFNFDYSQYDLLYMYRPIPDPLLQSQLQNCVMDGMKQGAVLVVVLQEGEDFRTNSLFPDLSNGWRKP